MELKSKLEILSKLDMLKFIHYNFFSKKVVRDKKCYLITFRGSVIELQKNARIFLHANYLLCKDKLKGSKAQAELLVREGGELIVEGTVSQIYGATIQVHKNAKMYLGQCIVNVGAVIIAGKELHIGQVCLISRDVYIYDSDHHKILDSEGNVANEAKPTFIGNHVWLGIGSKVLRGAKIGDGVMIAAGSAVMGKIKENTMALGYPARSFKSVHWEA